MAEEIRQWCGFCVAFYRLKEEKHLTATLKSVAPIRDNPEDALRDAHRLEAGAERHLKQEGVTAQLIQLGICPPEYLV